MSYKVVLPLKLSDESLKYPAWFADLGIEFQAKWCPTEEETIALAKDADAVIVEGSQRPMTRTIIENLERCRILAGTQIGFDTFDLAAASERGILVTNVPGYCVEEVSDHAMALVLACARRVVQLHKAVGEGSWGFGPSSSGIQNVIRPNIDGLHGKTLGLFGLGAIGRSMVPKAKGFGMRVIACDPYADGAMASREGVDVVDLPTLLSESDFVSIHAALTGETRGMFNRKVFSQMKPTACLINTARGGFINESDLYDALTSGQIGMAALDVLENEPPAEVHRLMTLDNFVCTGHLAFFSPQALATQ
ncbi:C-terminal binding protein [Chloroflexota bacterium]